MKKYFILLAGSPGTGKTYLMNKLRERFPDMYASRSMKSRNTMQNPSGLTIWKNGRNKKGRKFILSITKHLICIWKQERK